MSAFGKVQSQCRFGLRSRLHPAFIASYIADVLFQGPQAYALNPTTRFPSSTLLPFFVLGFSYQNQIGGKRVPLLLGVYWGT